MIVATGKNDCRCSGAKHGKNDFRRLGWEGPCPERGTDHSYLLKVYALDTEIDLEEGATKGEIVSAMTGHLIGVGQLMGTYYQRVTGAPL